MGRYKVYVEWDVPKGVVNIVRSICADYARRKSEIARGELSKEVLDKYAALNAVVDSALDEIEVGIREEMLVDIAHGRGYDVSAASLRVSKCAYYRRKRKAVHDIAYGLTLI